ncbi:MAG: 2-dehydro-3-deoxygalactonokinase, partial [Chitinophagaceae bacterium]
MKKYLLGCDWGTSAFRLWLYSLAEDKLIDDIQSADGVSGIHRTWHNGNFEAIGIAKNKFFFEKLHTQIKNISNKTLINLENTPVLISGMASSSIGIEDVPYSILPFSLDGSAVRCRMFSVQEDFPHEIILVSGVQDEHDVMRGEETQLIGIWSLLEKMGNQPVEAIIILPGTHSKHAYIKNGQLINFKTFMTGEMYHVLGNYSILKDSVKMQDLCEPLGMDVQAFSKGVQDSKGSGILNCLFTVRTNQLFNRLNKIENANYLSGLLIGSELQDLEKKQHCPLFLCCAKNLFGLYKLALEQLNLIHHTIFIPPDLVEKAAMTGQRI